MGTNRIKGDHVVFETAIKVHLMGIDGTWRRNCLLNDVSENGARLTVEGSLAGLNLTEFFLLLSSTGLAYRRCKLTWVKAEQIGVSFSKQARKKISHTENDPLELVY